MSGDVALHLSSGSSMISDHHSMPSYSPHRRRIRTRQHTEQDHMSLSSDLLSLASDYSQRASRYWKAQRYDDALNSYQEALDIYRRDAENARDLNAIVDECNAAATLHNMGLVHKRCRRYEQAVRCFQEGEELYRACMRALLAQPRTNITLEAAREVCLEHMLAETLQSRAGIHSRYLEEITAAIDCHEHVVSLMLGLDMSFDEAESNRQIACGNFDQDGGNVAFVRMNDAQRGIMLSVSLKELGSLNAKRGFHEDALTSFEEAMEILKCQHHEHPDDVDIQKKMATVFMSMAGLYFEVGEFDNAIEALQKSMDMRIALDNDAAHPDVLAAMNNMGIIHERRGNLDAALDCYEHVLMLRAESLGEDHVDVAHSLRTVAAVMALQGNWVGALDLYEESLRIFRKSVIDLNASYMSQVKEVLCRMADLYVKNGEFDEAIHAYQDALTSQRALTGESHSDVAHIYDQLAQVYMMKESHHAAYQYFRQSLRLFKANGMLSNDPQARAIKQKIELAKRLHEKQTLVLQSESEASDDMPLVWDPSKEDYVQAMSSFPEQDGPNVQVESSQSGTEITMLSVDRTRGTADSSPVEVRSTNRFSDDCSDADDDDDIIPIDSLSQALMTLPSETENEDLCDDPATSVSDPMATKDLEDRSHDKIFDGSDIGDKERNIVQKETGNKAVEEVRCLSPVASEFESEYVVFQNASGVNEEEDRMNNTNAGEKLPRLSSGSCEIYASPHESSSIVSQKSNNIDTTALEVACDNCLSHEDDRVNVDESSQHVPCASPESRHEGSPTGSHEIKNKTKGTVQSKKRSSLLDDTISHESSSGSEPDENNSVKSNRNVAQDRRKSQSSRSEPTVTSRQKQTTSPRTPRKSVNDLSPSTVRKSINDSSPSTARKSVNDSPYKGSKASPRHRFTKALSKRFRRGSQSTPLDSMPENSESVPRKQEDISKHKPPTAPVRFVSISSDDSVSQITFTPEDYVSRRSLQSGGWWWGGASEGLDGWFPSEYVQKAVAVAEDFLSASSIHHKQKLGENSAANSDADERMNSCEFDMLSHGAVGTVKSSLRKNEEKGLLRESRQDSPVSTSSVDAKGKTRDFDYLLGNVNVVHCEMKETDSAVPFIEVVNTDVVRDEVSSTKEKESRPSSPRKKKQHDAPASSHSAEDPAMDEILVFHESNKRNEVPAELVTVAKVNNTTLLEAFRIQKSELGDHEDVARSCHVLAEKFARKKDYESALEYYKEAYKIEEIVFGVDRPENAKTLNSIGMLLVRRGDFDQAVEHLKKALELVNDHYGDDISNPLVAQTLICIGAVYYKERNSLSTIRSNADGCCEFMQSGILDKIGKAHESVGSYRMAVAFFEEKLQLISGVDCLDEQEEVAQTLQSLGTLACHTGHFLEALDYYDKALAIQQKLGCDQLKLAESRVLTGVVNLYLGQYSKARQELEEALLMQRGTVGDKHESVANTLCHIGAARATTFNYDSATVALEEALAIQKPMLGADHPATLQTRLEIAKVASDRYELESALEQLNDILLSQKRIHGEQHPNIAETLHSIAKTQARNEKLSDALKTYEECFFMREKFLGIDHPLVATTLHSIAAVHARNTRHEKALRILSNVLTIRRETLGENHIDVARTLASQGSSYTALGNMSKATLCYKKAIPIAEDAVGKSNPAVADIHVNMANLLLRKCKFDDAKKHVEMALEVYKAFQFPDDHPRILSTMRAMDRIEREEQLCV